MPKNPDVSGERGLKGQRSAFRLAAERRWLTIWHHDHVCGSRLFLVTLFQTSPVEQRCAEEIVHLFVLRR